MDIKIKTFVLTLSTATLCWLLFNSFTGDDFHLYPNYLQKKIDRQIRKTFEVEKFHTRFFRPKADDFNRDFFEVKNPDSAALGYGIITLSNGCKKGGCTIENEAEGAEYDEFYFSTLYNANGEILSVRVIEYNSERGYEITARNWLRQFIGKRGGKLKVSKDIDAISGATVSVNSIVKEINAQQDFVKQ